MPDVGEENSGQAHHHLIGEKPRWPIILTLFNFEESAPFGVLKAKLMTLLVSRVLLRKPPLKKSKVPLKYQVSLFILILIFILTTTTNSHRQSFRFHFTSQLTLNLFPSSTLSYPFAQNDLQYIYCCLQGIKIISNLEIEIKKLLAGH